MIQTSHNMVSDTRNSTLSDIACVTNTNTDIVDEQTVEEVPGVEKFKTSGLDEWYKHILEINFFEIVGLASANEDENKFNLRLSKVPLSFKSPEQYFGIFQPLVLEEFKAQLHSTFWETSYPWEKMYHGTLSVLLLEKNGSFYLVSLVHYDDDGDSTPFKVLKRNDLVLLTKQPPGNDSCNDVHLVGKVEEFDRYKKMRTGKTHTIVGVVSCLLSWVQGQNSTQNFQNETSDSQLNEEENSLSKGRVLICAQSNAAVDELVSRISNTGLYGDDGKMYMPYIVRVGNAETTHPNSMPFFIDTLVDHCLAEEIMQLGIAKNDSIKQFCVTLYIYKNKLMRKISTYKVKCAKTSALEGDGVKEMSKAEAGRLYYEKEQIVKDLSAAQAQDFMSANENINTLKLMLRQAIIRQANIVFATLNGCGGDVYRFCYVPKSIDTELLEQSKNVLFDAVVIDEAAQALEPATLIPLQLLKQHGYGSKCIMVGDPKQLPATVMSKVASKFLYGRSMFERLQRAGYPVTMLTKQYRMHPEISRFPSMQFYHGKLLNGENMSTKSASFHECLGLGPYLFYDVMDGKELQGRNSGGFSLSNEHEAEAVVNQLKFFKERYPSEFQSRRFGIITPYKSQLSLKRSCFSSAFEPSIVANMEFHTVDGFQGREVDIVILSTVRAAESNPSSIGFVADVRRMNVSLTRAKISLWIFGNARTLQINHNWAAPLRDAKQRNLVISVSKKSEPSMKRVPAKRPRAWNSVASNGIRISKRRKEYHRRLDRGKRYESINYSRSYDRPYGFPASINARRWSSRFNSGGR